MFCSRNYVHTIFSVIKSYSLISLHLILNSSSKGCQFVLMHDMTRPRVVRIADRNKLNHTSEDESMLNHAVTLSMKELLRGGVIAVPTDTIYGLAGLAQNADAIHRIYDIKGRGNTKPIAISVGCINDVYRWSKVAVSRHILEDLLPGPVTVVGERHAELNPLLNPGSHLVAIRIPDHYFMQQLLHMCDGPIGLTSANKSASQSTLSLDEFEYLWPQLDLLVDGGVLNDTDKSRLGSTVVDLTQKGKFSIIREGCAYRQTVDILRHKHNLEDVSDDH